MPDNNWNDDKIEYLLRSMPKASDERSASDILDQLKKDDRLMTKSSNRFAKKWIPGLVAVAALFVLSLLVPSMLNGNKGQMNISSEPATMRTEGKGATESVEMEESEQSSAAEESMDAASFSLKSVTTSHVIIPDDYVEGRLFPIGLIHEATVIPVTFIMPEEMITNDFPGSSPSSVELYNKYVSQVREEELGFDDYHPYKGEISESADEIIHQVGENHLYDNSPTTLEIYTNSAIATFSTDHTKWKVVDEKGNPVAFDYIGLEMEFHLERRGPYFKYVMADGRVYLVPYQNGDTKTVSEALLAMRQATNDVVQEVIPSGVDYSVEVQDGTIMLTFDASLDLTRFAINEVNEMLEGFMLTAESYDMQIQLKNVQQEFFGNYDLTKPLPKPVGVNPIMWR